MHHMDANKTAGEEEARPMKQLNQETKNQTIYYLMLDNIIWFHKEICFYV